MGTLNLPPEFILVLIGLGIICTLASAALEVIVIIQRRQLHKELEPNRRILLEEAYMLEAGRELKLLAAPQSESEASE